MYRKACFLAHEYTIISTSVFEMIRFSPLNYFGTFCKTQLNILIESSQFWISSLLQWATHISSLCVAAYELNTFLSFGKCNKGFDTQTMKRNFILKRWNFEYLFVADGERVGGRAGNCLHF